MAAFLIASLGCSKEKHQSAVDDRQKKTELTSSTAMHSAAMSGDIQAVRALIKEGADVDRPLENGNTALMLAAYKGNPAIAELLIKSGAHVNKVNMYNQNALTYAASGDSVETYYTIVRKILYVILPKTESISLLVIYYLLD